MYPLERVEGAVDGSEESGRLEEVFQVQGTINGSEWRRRGTQDIASKGFLLVNSFLVIFGCPGRFGSKHSGSKILLVTDPPLRSFGTLKSQKPEVKISKDKKEEKYQENLKHINGTGSNAHNAEFAFKSLFFVGKATLPSRQ